MNSEKIFRSIKNIEEDLLNIESFIDFLFIVKKISRFSPSFNRFLEKELLSISDWNQYDVIIRNSKDKSLTIYNIPSFITMIVNICLALGTKGRFLSKSYLIYKKGISVTKKGKTNKYFNEITIKLNDLLENNEKTELMSFLVNFIIAKLTIGILSKIVDYYKKILHSNYDTIFNLWQMLIGSIIFYPCLIALVNNSDKFLDCLESLISKKSEQIFKENQNLYNIFSIILKTNKIKIINLDKIDQLMTYGHFQFLSGLLTKSKFEDIGFYSKSLLNLEKVYYFIESKGWNPIEDFDINFNKILNLIILGKEIGKNLDQSVIILKDFSSYYYIIKFPRNPYLYKAENEVVQDYYKEIIEYDKNPREYILRNITNIEKSIFLNSLKNQIEDIRFFRDQTKKYIETKRFLRLGTFEVAFSASSDWLVSDVLGFKSEYSKWITGLLAFTLGYSVDKIIEKFKKKS